jgi:hypothetical protein
MRGGGRRGERGRGRGRGEENDPSHSLSLSFSLQLTRQGQHPGGRADGGRHEGKAAARFFGCLLSGRRPLAGRGRLALEHLLGVRLGEDDLGVRGGGGQEEGGRGQEGHVARGGGRVWSGRREGRRRGGGGVEKWRGGEVYEGGERMAPACACGLCECPATSHAHPCSGAQKGATFRARARDRGAGPVAPRAFAGGEGSAPFAVHAIGHGRPPSPPSSPGRPVFFPYFPRLRGASQVFDRAPGAPMDRPIAAPAARHHPKEKNIFFVEEGPPRLEGESGPPLFLLLSSFHLPTHQPCPLRPGGTGRHARRGRALCGGSVWALRGREKQRV